MAMTIQDPNQQVQQPDGINTTGPFGTENPSPSLLPTQAAPADPTQTAILNGALSKSNVNVQQGGSSGGGIGSILGPIGSILGGLFAQGGLVGDKLNGFAAGGAVHPDAAKNHAAAAGYLVGALHQKKYGGNPQDFGKAAAEIKAMLQQGPQGGQSMPVQGTPGFADGGGVVYPSGGVPDNINGDAVMVQQALNQSLGLNAPDQVQANPQALAGDNATSTAKPQPTQAAPEPAMSAPKPSNAGPNLSVINPQNQTSLPTGIDPNNPNGQGVTVNPQQQMFNTVAGAVGSNNNVAPYAKGGYMQSLAVGGPPMPMPQQGQTGPQQGPPPLKPGQTFMGDGSVKGPGGPQDDAIPARLSNGEFVMSEPAVQFFGVDKLNKMNEQGKQGYMQALAQVQGNQPGGPNGPPQQPQPNQQPPMQAQQMPPQAQPVGQAKGGMMGKPNSHNNMMAQQKGFMSGYAGM